MWNGYGVCCNLASSCEPPPPVSHDHFNHWPSLCRWEYKSNNKHIFTKYVAGGGVAHMVFSAGGQNLKLRRQTGGGDGDEIPRPRLQYGHRSKRRLSLSMSYTYIHVFCCREATRTAVSGLWHRRSLSARARDVVVVRVSDPSRRHQRQDDRHPRLFRR